MDILNTVIALLGLLATVIIGTAKITWTIAQVFFGIRTTQNTIRENKLTRKNDRPMSTKLERSIFLNCHVRGGS